MGTVYRAEHTVLGSPAAVKILLPQFTQDPVVVDRLFQEARAASAIRHAGIVEVFDYGRLPTGQAYIAMELLRGEDLSAFLVRCGKLEASLAAQIAMQTLRVVTCRLHFSSPLALHRQLALSSVCAACVLSVRPVFCPLSSDHLIWAWLATTGPARWLS